MTGIWARTGLTWMTSRPLKKTKNKKPKNKENKLFGWTRGPLGSRSSFWFRPLAFGLWPAPKKLKRPGRLYRTQRISEDQNPFTMSILVNVPSFHPASIDQRVQACKGRRTDPDHADRNFRPFIYAAFQCGGHAVQDSDGLCATCMGHRSRGVEWHGRVDEPLDQMPITSHIAGGPWFAKMIAEDKIRLNDRPLTAKQEGRLARAPLVPEAQLRRFACGEIDLNIEILAAKRQISTQDLINIIGWIGANISRKVRFGSKAALCAAIRACRGGPPEAQPTAGTEATMQPPAGTEATMQPQHFNPEEDNYEVEVQQMAPAGDESPLNIAFCESEVEEQPPKKARRTLVPDWSQIPANAEVRWDFNVGDSHYTSCGRHVGQGQILFGEVISSSPADFIKKELAIWKSLGRVAQDMKAPHNAWKALEFQRNGAWVRFDAIRV